MLCLFCVSQMAVNEEPSKRGNTRSVESLLRRDGSWADSLAFSVPVVRSMKAEGYFGSYEGYYREHGISPPAHNEAVLQKRFGNLEGLKYKSSFDDVRYGALIARAFHIGGEYRWRAAAPHERLFSRPATGYVAIPVAHFKAGLRPRPHRFLVALYKQEFRCSMAQFSPNSIRLILWFIAACHKRGMQPTFKAFFTIFTVKRSGREPFYELAQCSSRSKLGSLLGGFQPVIKPKCLKFWFHEYIMIAGGDWEYMPGFVREGEVGSGYVIPRKKLSTQVLGSLCELVKAFPKSWEVKSFYRVEFLRRHNCESIWWFEFV